MKRLIITSIAIFFSITTPSFSDENNGGVLGKLKNATCEGFFFGIKAGKNCDKNQKPIRKTKNKNLKEKPAIKTSTKTTQEESMIEKLKAATCEGFFFGIRAGKNCKEKQETSTVSMQDQDKELVKQASIQKNSLNNNLSNNNISLYTGTFDVIDKEGDDQSSLFGVEHRNPNLFKNTFLGKFSPLTGVFMTGDSSVYLYTGIEGQYGVGPLKILPSFAPGYYQKGDGKDLGHVLEFKSEIKLALDIFENSKLGYSYSHISNNDWGDTNPGTDNQQITFSKNF